MRYSPSVVLAIAIVLVIASCSAPTERLGNYTVHGIDVSHHQSSISWSAIQQEGISFSYMKATEGQDFVDSLFNFNWEQSKNFGIKRGAYHFFRPGKPALHQALNFIKQVDLKLGDLPPALDVEVDDDVSDVVAINRIRSWLQIVEKHYAIRPIIYTNLKFYKRFIHGNFKDYPVWIARYNKEAPPMPSGQDWLFWQYGNRGRLNGIDGPVDLNVFYGNLSQLDALGYGAGPIYSSVPL